MGYRSGAVTREVTMAVVVPADVQQRVPVVMRYDRSDPFAVAAEFQATPTDRVAWVFARELLAHGMRVPIGEGDVRVWPTADGAVRISLTSPDGEALVEVAAADVAEFLRQSYALCPLGAEAANLDVDGALRALFAS